MWIVREQRGAGRVTGRVLDFGIMAMFIGSTRARGHESGCVRLERAGMNQVKPSKQYSSVHPMLSCKNTDLWDAVAMSTAHHRLPLTPFPSFVVFSSARGSAQGMASMGY